MFRITAMRTWTLLAVLAVGPAWSQAKTAHYIVELSDAPAAEHFKGRPHGTRPALSEIAAHRETVRSGQAGVRKLVEQAGAKVHDSTQVASNTLIVSIAADKVDSLSKLPGVSRVYKAREFKPLLDHAAIVHAVDQAWLQVGIDKAGAGIKIGMIDSGVDNSHPGFQSAALQMPSGFPKANADTDLLFTNSKVIVARSYVSLLDSRDIDYSARDRVGHGTASAMCAAGVTNGGPNGSITGMAPAAYIGSYKVFGTPTYNDGATDAAILKALDDAVADGMDVINLSLGYPIASRLSDDTEVAAVERISSLGIIVVAAAGNGTVDTWAFSPNAIMSPATAPSVIAVGASENEREFVSTVKLPDGTTYIAINSQTSPTSGQVSGPLADVAQFDPSGQACSALPSASLAGKIALVARGVCTFEVKLANVQAAGAMGALVYSTQASPDAVSMAVSSTQLGSQMVSYTDGIAIKGLLAANPGLSVTLIFSPSPFPMNALQVGLFSSRGPNVDNSIKPDLLGVGINVSTAAQAFDDNGELYDPSGYTVTQGTSFASPIVAGSAAVLKAARPGLTVEQYKSLLVNSAAAVPSSPSVQSSGAGELNLMRALNSTLAIAPVSASFGAGTSSIQSSGRLSVTNLGTAPDTFSISVTPRGDGPAPVVDSGSLTIAAGATAPLTLSFAATGLAAGAYEGFVNITSNTSGFVSRVPYWYAVSSNIPANIVVLDMLAAPPPSGTTQLGAVYFRVCDAAGLALSNIKPTATVTSGGGSILGINNNNSLAPGLYSLDVRMGPKRKTDNVFHIVAGDATYDITITTN